MGDIEISVIIACYNPKLDKLLNTVKSIINQKDVSFEIIVSDDGSKTDYSNELNAWTKENGIESIKLNFLKENVGTVANILSALKFCDGKYVKTISPGDYLFDEYSLKNYLKVFEEKNADIVFGRAQYFTTDGKVLPFSAPVAGEVYKNKRVRRDILLFQDYVLGASVCARKEVEIKYLTEIVGKIKLLEDVPLTLLALADDKKICGTEDKLVWYEYGEGVSTNPKTSGLLDKDYLATFDILSKRNDKYAKKAVVFYNATKIKNPLKRFIKKIMISVGYIPYRLNIFFSRKPKNTCIKKMEKIIR